MAVLRIELEIDSEVHPELYARLASLERLPAREEKLRQLAATGLIWEIDRLHGPAFLESQAAAAEAAALAPLASEADRAPGFPVAVDAGAVEDHASHAPANVPVLHDIVDEADAVGAEPVPASVLTLVAPVPMPMPEPAPPPVTGKTRSARMKRMKEAGLFQDG
jgi:hypothetical protein